MAYTRPWAQVMNLPGSRDADEIDDENREGHTDFTERFGDILFDVTADPWILKVPGVNIDGTVSYRYPAHGGISGAGAASRANPLVVQPSAAGASCELFFPITAPQGSKIRAFDIHGWRTIIGASVQAELWEVDWGTAAATNLATVSLALIQPGIQSGISGIIDRPMMSTTAFYIRVVLTADASGATTAELLDIGYTVKLAGTP